MSAGDPIARFRERLEAAKASEPDVPSAMTLATVDEHGFPHARVVLLRGIDERGFVFYTNYTSNKAKELEATGRAALCVHWKTLRQQVRVEGTVARVSDAQSDAYFASRPQRSQLAAIASKQSQMLPSRETLVGRYEALIEEHGDDAAPRPGFWGGFVVEPIRIEFWTHGEHRLHIREVYDRTGQGWSTRLLYP